ncbi:MULTISPECIES: ATP-binding protein [Cyanophyceae]|uniref:ATP-binding protein n=1 Tax=Cyanophyceae TaxID=3028117 RepID=UPI0016887F95|nr:ATP-binding protein [Trichocoleus sp. FACHB-40]MBD2002077.1 PAS domain S-box protein [Trichocoleus sp. FACHB-40]
MSFIVKLPNPYPNFSPTQFNRLTSRLRIRQKIVYGYSLAISIAVLGGTTGIIFQQYNYARAAEQVEKVRVRINSLNNLQTAILQARSQQRELLLISNDIEDLEQETPIFIQELLELKELIKETQIFLNNSTPYFKDLGEDKEDLARHYTQLTSLINKYENILQIYDQELKTVLEGIEPSTVKTKKLPSAQQALTKFINGKTTVRLNYLTDELSKLINLYQEREAKAGDRLYDEAGNLGSLIIIISLLVSAAIAVILAVYTSKAIAQPIEAITKVAQQVTEESNFNLQAPVTTEDEVGKLTISLNQMIRRVATYTQDIKQKQHQLDNFFNISFDMLCIAGFDGYFKFVNPAFEKTLGYTTEELLSSQFIDFVHPEDKAATIAESEKLSTGITTSYHFQNRYRCKDGSYKWLAWTSVQSPQEKLIYASARDITPTKVAEEALREQATKLSQTLQELQQTQSQLIQTEKMSSLGQMVAGIAHEINNPINFIYGNLEHTSEYLQDLLRLVHIYQQHPYSSPEIEEVSEEIDLEFITEDVPKMLSSMKVGAKRIQQMVLSLRNFSRLDEAEVKDVNLHEGIDSTLLILSNKLKKEVKVIKQYGNLPLIECYPAQINQVFMNIISNAIDALLTDEKKSNKQIIIKTIKTSDNQIQVRIRDNGLGIALPIKDKIFDPFFTTKPVGQGTGLGLSICYQIIEKHGGKISVNSQIGEGTEFAIALPLKQTSSQPVSA